MIEIGKQYTLVMLELTESGYGKGSISVKVTGRDANLIEVNGCEIFNTASPLFHSLTDVEAQKAYFAKLEEEIDALL